MPLQGVKKAIIQEKTHNGDTYKTPNPLLYVVSIPLLILSIPILCCLALYKFIVKSLLLYKHGDRFGGFLAGADHIWAYDDVKWKSVVNCLFFLECDEEVDVIKIATLRTKQNVFDVDDYPKLKATLHRYLGLPFLIKNDYSLNECLKPITVPNNEPFTETVLRDALSKVSNEPLPKNGTALWEILVSDRPLVTKTSEKYVYPVIVRFNHAVGDGASFVSFFVKVYSNTRVEEYLKDTLKRYSAYLYPSPAKFDIALVVEFGKTVLHYLYLIWALPPYVICTFLTKTEDNNALHGSNLCGEKNAVWSCEYKQDLVSVVKRVKNRFPEVRFSDVIYTALSASITDFYKRNDFQVPSQINVAVPHILSLKNLTKPGPVTLRNEFSIASLSIPTVTRSLTETLLEVKEQTVLMRNRPDLELAYWILQLLTGFCPDFLLRFFATLPGATAALTNVPGTAKVDFFNMDLRNVVFYAPNRKKTGVTISIFTYDNRFQIGIQVDRALIPSIDETQRIADDIFRYIRLLDLESTSLQNISL